MAKSFSFSFDDSDFGNQFCSSYQAFSLFMEPDRLRDLDRTHSTPNNLPVFAMPAALMIRDLDLTIIAGLERRPYPEMPVPLLFFFSSRILACSMAMSRPSVSIALHNWKSSSELSESSSSLISSP
jgi:hypothetical protein